MSHEIPALPQACNALWLATLLLMTAFMQTRAPAHRYLLARRVSQNFATLQAQDCYAGQCRKVFAQLALRWGRTADRLALQDDRPRSFGNAFRDWLSQALSERKA